MREGSRRDPRNKKLFMITKMKAGYAAALALCLAFVALGSAEGDAEEVTSEAVGDGRYSPTFIQFLTGVVEKNVLQICPHKGGAERRLGEESDGRADDADSPSGPCRSA